MSMQRPDRKHLLDMYAALPEAYQPAWGLDETREQAQRACADRLSVLLASLESLPVEGPLRILDIGCAQGYFALALQHELTQRGRAVELVGVDYLEDNADFCRALAAYHDSPVSFLHDRFDAGFFNRQPMADFHAILALNVLHHVHELDGAQAAHAALDAIRAHGRVLFCELAQREENLAWIGARATPDEGMLSGYAFRRRLGRFATHLTDVRRPLYACSTSLALVGERWFAFERTRDRSHAGVPDAFSGQRRFFFGQDVVVKGYRGDGEFGEFNRGELDAEAANLDKLDGEPDRYPGVLARADDGEMLWLARGLLPGRLLSEAIDAADAFDGDGVVRALLDELAHLEARGYWHADLRCWNVLLHASGVRLIDFGAMTETQSPLHRVALAAVLLEIARGKLNYEQPYYAALHPLTRYPENWHPLMRYLLETPQDEFRFAGAVEAFGSRRSSEQRKLSLCPSADILEAVAHEQCAAFRRLNEHAMESQRLGANATAHAEALTQALACQRREGDAERDAVNKALASADAHSADLERSLVTAIKHANSLEQAITEKDAYAASLEIERKQFEQSLAAATTHANSLEQAITEKDAYAASLEVGRKQLEQSLAAATTHAGSLEQAIREKDVYAASLEAERARVGRILSDAVEHARSLEQSLKQKDIDCASLVADRDQLQNTLDRATRRLAALQRRFRWLRPLWPHEKNPPGNGP